jgi:hypothetical protein
MKSLRRIAITAAAVLGLAIYAIPSSAHHSFAAFDTTKTVELKGVVVEFQWTNPHSWIELDVPGVSGAVDRWSIELKSPNNLSRQGWKRKDLQPGDKITLTAAPMRDGQKSGLFRTVVLADGRIHKDPSVRAGAAGPAQPAQ